MGNAAYEPPSLARLAKSTSPAEPSSARPALSEPRLVRERHVVRTGDGIALSIRRVRSSSVPTSSSVVLLHGLASGSLGFDYPGRSLAAFLADRGLDVFLPELRGHGESQAPTAPWNLDDYLTHDLPTVFSTVQQLSGHAECHFVGHSMGGVLLFCLLALHGQPRQRLALRPGLTLGRAITIGSAWDYQPGNSGFRPLLRLRGALTRVAKIPYGNLMRGISPLLGRRFSAVERFNLWPANTEARVIRGLHRGAFHSIPVPLLLQLSGALDGSGLAVLGQVRQLRNTAHPVLLIGGSKDPQATIEAVSETAQQLGAHASLRGFGRQFGTREEYGHWDLLVGRHATQEVWPSISHFLAATIPQ